jgi:hypothetical protein
VEHVDPTQEMISMREKKGEKKGVKSFVDNNESELAITVSWRARFVSSFPELSIM